MVRTYRPVCIYIYIYGILLVFSMSFRKENCIRRPSTWHETKMFISHGSVFPKPSLNNPFPNLHSVFHQLYPSVIHTVPDISLLLIHTYKHTISPRHWMFLLLIIEISFASDIHRVNTFFAQTRPHLL